MPDSLSNSDPGVPPRPVPSPYATSTTRRRGDPAGRLCFDSSLEIDSETRRVRWRGVALDLPSRSFDVLHALAEEPGRIVERNDLLERVWPDVVVSDASLTQAVSTLRKALGDDPAARALVVTVAGRGYQLADSLAPTAPAREASADLRAPDAPNLAVLAGKSSPRVDAGSSGEGVGSPDSPKAPESLGWPRSATVSSRRLFVAALALGLVACLAVIVWSGWRVPFDPAAGLGRSSTVSASTPELMVREAMVQEPMVREAMVREAMVPEAELALMAGFAALDLRTIESIRAAIDSFERVLTIESTSATASAGLAESWFLRATYDPAVRPLDAYAQARRWSRSAIDLDSDSARAHAALGMVLFGSAYDWAGAAASLERAVALDPDAVRPHHWLSWVLRMQGHDAAAIESLARARSLDPRSPILATATGTQHLYRGDAAAARDWQQTVVDQYPRFGRARLNLGVALEALGAFGEARVAFEETQALEPDSAEVLAALAHLELRSGDATRGHRLLADLERRAASSHDHGGFGYPLALAYTANGDLDRAHKALAAAVASRGVFPPHVLFDPRLEPLRKHPPTRALLERFAFPVEGRAAG